MSHTPGPWEVGGPYPSVSVIVCVDGGHCGHGGMSFPEPPQYEPICFLDQRTEGEPNAQTLADAHLIAAAPELLEAVEKLVSAMKMQEGRQSGEFHIPPHTADFIWSGAQSVARAAIKKAIGE